MTRGVGQLRVATGGKTDALRRNCGYYLS